MKERNKGIDNVKAYATIMVILAHALNDNYFVSDYARINVLSRIFNTFFSILSSTAVPLFLMATGYFLYDRERNFKEILKNKIFPLWLPFAVWIILNRPLNFYSILSDLPAILKELFLLKSPWPHYLWYIPALFGIYLLSPIIRKLLLSLKKKDYLYAFGIVLFVKSFDYYDLLSRMYGGNDITLTIGIYLSTSLLFMYSIYAYYFKHYIEKEKYFKKSVGILAGLLLILFMLQFQLINHQIGHRIYYYPLGILLSFLTFNIIYHLKVPKIFEKVVRFFSMNSLSYYFAHRFILYQFNQNYFFYNRPVNTLLSFLLSIVIITGFLVIYQSIKKGFSKDKSIEA